jgi:hypothetical protein
VLVNCRSRICSPCVRKIHHGIFDPYIARKTRKEMFDALVTCYESENINRNMLRNKLRAMPMSKTNTIACLLDEDY